MTSAFGEAGATTHDWASINKLPLMIATAGRASARYTASGDLHAGPRCSLRGRDSTDRVQDLVCHPAVHVRADARREGVDRGDALASADRVLLAAGSRYRSLPS